MKKLIFLFTLTAVIFTTTNLSLLAQTQRGDNTYMITVKEVYFFDELDYAFYQAFNSFQNGENAKAGARLRRAAYFVKSEAENAKANNKKPILNQAERLESLADSVALGKINSAYRIRRAAVRSHHVLAHDYKMRAAAAWAGEKAEDTGQAMVAAAGYLGHAAKWSGKKIEQGAVHTGKAIGKAGKATAQSAKKTGKKVAKGTEIVAVESFRGVRWLGGKMVKGLAFLPQKVGQGLEWLGDGINKIGDDIEPKPRKN